MPVLVEQKEEHRASISQGAGATMEDAQPRIFWVNQGINYAQEREGGYVQAPKQNAQGTQFGHWKRVSELKPGDLLAHYHNKALCALGRVTAIATDMEGGAWRTSVEYFPLQEAIGIDGIAEYLRTIQPASGPFTDDGLVKQGYLWDFNAAGLATLRRLSREPWPEWADALTRGLSPQRWVKISPGEDARLWDECLSGGYIRVGWDAAGDLRRHASFEDLRKAFAAMPEMKGSPARHVSRKARELWTLTALRPGDRVVANRGTSEVLAVGEVVEPGYEWRPDRPSCQHTVRMRWFFTQSCQTPPEAYWAFATVAEVSPELRALLTEHIRVKTEAPPAQEPATHFIARSLVGNHRVKSGAKAFPRQRPDKSLDIAILTVIPPELFAVLDALGIPQSDREKDALGTVYFRGSLRSELAKRDYQILVTCIGSAGNYDAAAAANDVIVNHRPRVLLLLGIAAGIRGKVRIGEVVLSERVVAYEPAALVAGNDQHPARMEHRPEIDRLPHGMNQDVITYRPDPSRLGLRFRRNGGSFPSASEGSKEDFQTLVASTLVVRQATIASGEKILRDPAKLLAVRAAQHGKVEVGEMEAAGLVAACRRAGIPWLVIRGISDFGDQFKDDRFHEFASRAAATVLADFVSYGLSLSSDVVQMSGGTEASAALSGVVPHYPDEEARLLSSRLQNARARKQRLQSSGVSTTQIDQEILSLRRQMREGGQLRAGDSLGDGRFLLLEPIGSGGFGNIWKAQEQETQKIVAIKVLHSSLAGDVERRERFIRGARRMAELRHPAVVQVLEQHGEDLGYHYFVMEYVAGGNLRQAVLNKVVTPEMVVPIILQVGEALAHAHAQKLIHRDVKPANILLSEDGLPLLTDFDLVGAADTTGGTRTGALGTLVYAAPECLERPQDADARVDVYGLGMTTIFCLYGADIHFHQFMRNPESFFGRLPCSVVVREVLKRATSFAANDRYKDASEFVASLRDASKLEREVPGSAEIKRFRTDAKRLMKLAGMTYARALDQIAITKGFQSWWQIHRGAKRGGASMEPEEPMLVRFSVDSKHALEMDRFRLERLGIEQDEEFLEYLSDVAREAGDKDWYDLGAFEAVFRFTKWRSFDATEISKRVSKVFFFGPDRIWVDGGEIDVPRNIIK